MEIRNLTPSYAVSGQIAPDDAPALGEAGVTDVICNRPDREVGPDQSAEAIRSAVEAAGLRFHMNPVTSGALTEDMVNMQADVMDRADGLVFAYCRSGMRSTVVWALSRAHERDPDELIETAAKAGYDIAGMRPQLQALYDG